MANNGKRKTNTTRAKLESSPIRAIESEVKRRQRRIETLQRKREQVAEQLRDVEEQIAKLLNPHTRTRPTKSSGPTQKARTPKRSNLADGLAAAMAGKGAMTVTEAVDAVLQAGHRTKSSSFHVIVNRTLIMDPRFRQVERGKYLATPQPTT